jgi:undecaprenyl-diphosphatase
VDWSLFHWLNNSTRGVDGAQDTAEIFNTWAILVVIAVGGGLWLLARPSGPLRWKMATASATFAALLGLLANAALSTLWYDRRPFVAHPGQTVLLIRHARDNGFPSEHATVAFAIAFAVLVFSRPLGILLVLAAGAVAIDRVVVGVHYPADLAASFSVGLAAALLVTTVGRPYVTWAVRQVSRVTDPVVATARRPITRRSAR